MNADADLLATVRIPGWRPVPHPKMLGKFAVVTGYPGEGMRFVRDEADAVTAFPTPFAAGKYAERLNPLTPRSAAQVRAAFRGFLSDVPKPVDDLTEQLRDLVLILQDRAFTLHPAKTRVALVPEDDTSAPTLGFGDLLLVVHAFGRNPGYSDPQKATVLLELADAAFDFAYTITKATPA